MKIIDDIENGLFLASSKLPNAGVGLFTSKFIMEGVPVCEYKGDVFNNQDEMYKSNRYNYTLKEGFGLRSEYSLKHSNNGKIIDSLPWATKSVMGLGGFANDACNHEVRNSENYLNKKKEGRVSMFPVNFARGMNWKSKCVILDEAQNSTFKEIVTVLTRLGEGSVCFVLADPMQTDLKSRQLAGGFEKLQETFDDDESLAMGIYSFNFTEEDIMRSELVKFLVKKVNEQKERDEKEGE